MPPSPLAITVRSVPSYIICKCFFLLFNYICVVFHQCWFISKHNCRHLKSRDNERSTMRKWTLSLVEFSVLSEQLGQCRMVFKKFFWGDLLHHLATWKLKYSSNLNELGGGHWVGDIPIGKICCKSYDTNSNVITVRLQTVCVPWYLILLLLFRCKTVYLEWMFLSLGKSNWTLFFLMRNLGFSRYFGWMPQVSLVDWLG